jgi:hypothetical protein
LTLLDLIEKGIETPISLKRARELPILQRDGKRPDLAVLYRWASSGIRGHVLESVYQGGKRVTTAEAVLRFVLALNGQPATSRPPAHVEAIAAAGRRNAARGM